LSPGWSSIQRVVEFGAQEPPAVARLAVREKGPVAPGQKELAYNVHVPAAFRVKLKWLLRVTPGVEPDDAAVALVGETRNRKVSREADDKSAVST
jgi:hypothetical protein